MYAFVDVKVEVGTIVLIALLVFIHAWKLTFTRDSEDGYVVCGMTHG